MSRHPMRPRPRRTITFLCIALLAAGLPLPMRAQGEGEVRHPEAAFRYGRDSKTDTAGVIRALFNISHEVSGENPEEVARSYIFSRAHDLRIDDPAEDIRADVTHSNPGGSHVRFTQYHQDIPVYRGGLVVSIKGTSHVSMVVNNFLEDIRIPSAPPALTPHEAIAVAQRHMNVTGSVLGQPASALLMIYRAGQSDDRLTFRVTMTCTEPYGDWEIMVDAHSGRVLHVEDLFVDLREGERVQGRAYLYLSDPLSAARQRYGTEGFLDAGDSDSDSLRAYREYVTLDSLTYRDGLYRLAGPYCSVAEIEAPTDPPFYAATSPDAFIATRDEPAFEAVMAYYHATAAYKRLLHLGFDIPSLRALRLDPHGYLGNDNSHYSPTGNWMSFGTGGVDDAEDADVIWHEYGHAIIANINPYWGGGESRELGEGFSDYWAASYSRSLPQWKKSDAEYEWLYNWDGHNPYWKGRILNDSRTYPFGNLPVHEAGQVWSSALMQIQGELGREITDILVLKSLYYLGYAPSAIDNALAILQADRDLYGGAHLPTLIHWLGPVKQFLPPELFDAILIVHDDDALPRGSASLSAQTGDTISAERISSFLFDVASLPFGVQGHAVAFQELDTAALGHYQAIVLVGGANPEPFNDPLKRLALSQYVINGGRILVEGGDVGYFYRKDELRDEDPLFRRIVLHDSLYLSDAPDASYLYCSPAQALFMSPHTLSSPIEFGPFSTPGTRDAVLQDPHDGRAFSIGEWSPEPAVGAILASADESGNIRTLFLPFAIGSLVDTSAARCLIENALLYLLSGRSPVTDVHARNDPSPEAFSLSQNYPNPFNPRTTIRFSIPEAGGRLAVRLEVFDMLGQRVAILVRAKMEPGTYEEQFDASDLPSGAYFYRLSAQSPDGSGVFRRTERMVLLR